MDFLRWIGKAIIVVVVIITAVIVLGSMGGAQTAQCAPLDKLVEGLAANYHEQLIGDGQGPNGARLLVFAHPDGTTWTIVAVIPSGEAYLVASGIDWTSHDFTPAGTET